MSDISLLELEIIKKLHLGGRGIHVIAHVPQKSGGCHPFDFLRGVFPDEAYDEAFERTKPEVLQRISNECDKSCQCNNGEPSIWYIEFGRR